MVDVTLLVGIGGVSFILLAFFLDQFFNKICNQDMISYNVLNIIGSGLLIGYAYLLISIPFMVLNGVWFIVTVVKLVAILRD
ncbi:TPA: hypothetical protein HA278_00085 [Candidatus Woesearchaeota archaeon]|nr:hypothetical protein [archaeon]HIJ10427.1 hypothetical protein [Candidatus Woesearchaeota archaeon]